MTCSFPGCAKKVKAKGLCTGHYEQVRLGRLKQPLLPRFPRRTDLEFFMDNLSDQGLDECWNWAGYIDDEGYGRMRGYWRPHRFAYSLWVASIPEGYDIHHDCYNKICCNPNHLTLIHHSAHVSLHNNND